METEYSSKLFSGCLPYSNPYRPNSVGWAKQLLVSPMHDLLHKRHMFSMLHKSNLCWRNGIIWHLLPCKKVKSSLIYCAWSIIPENDIFLKLKDFILTNLFGTLAKFAKSFCYLKQNIQGQQCWFHSFLRKEKQHPIQRMHGKMVGFLLC